LRPAALRSGDLADAAGARRVRAENDIPPGRTHREAALIVFEVVAHVQLEQETAKAPAQSPVVENEVQHVVRQVTAEEARGDRPGVVPADRADKAEEEGSSEWQRDRR